MMARCWLAGLFLALDPGLAWGQVGDAEGLDSQSAASAIVVTAQRRSGTLDSVPSSVAVKSGDELAIAGISSLDEIGGMVPGLVLSPPVGLTSAVYLRGVGSDSRNIGFDGRVGVYLDGVYVGQSPSLALDMVDVARIEVLRGPQGTLFGKNSIAGAVNIISRSPSGTAAGALRLRAGSREFRSLSGSADLPLLPGLAARIVASARRQGGWVDNLYDNSRLGGLNSSFVRGQVHGKLAANLEISLAVSRQVSESKVFIGNNLTDTFAFGRDGQAPGRRQVMFSTTPAERRKLEGVLLTVDHILPDGGHVVSNSSYRTNRYHIVFDEDWSAARFLSADYRDDYRAVAQELQLVSPDDRALTYLLGFYFQRQDNGTARKVVAGADVAALPFGIVSGAMVANAGEIDTRSLAAYLDLGWVLTDRLKAGLGLRYSHDRKRVDWTISGEGMPAFNLATGRLASRMMDDDVSPSMSLSYSLSASSKLYLRYAEGFKSGGFNLDFVSADIFPGRLRFGKETVRSLEFGGKVQTPAWSLNVAVFHSRYADYQVNQFQDLGGGRTAIVIANAASVRSRGMELDGQIRLGKQLAISGSAVYTDARFLRYPSGGVGGSDVAGHRLPYASRWAASLAGDWIGSSALLLGGRPLVHMDTQFRSGFFTTVDNVRRQSLPAGATVRFGHVGGHVMINAATGLAWNGRSLQLTIWARNLLGQTRASWMARDFLGTIVEVSNEPRAFGLALEWRFGSQ